MSRRRNIDKNFIFFTYIKIWAVKDIYACNNAMDKENLHVLMVYFTLFLFNSSSYANIILCYIYYYYSIWIYFL